MKFLIALNLFLSTACASAPQNKMQKEEVMTTFECFAADTKAFQEKVSNNQSLTGLKVSCKNLTFTVDTYVIHGPEEVIILNKDTGTWENFKNSDCGLIYE